MTLEACAQCGFDPDRVGPDRVADEIDRWVAACAARIADIPRDVLAVPTAGLSWSPIEYLAHVRDVAQLFTERVRAILAVDDPDLTVVDHDELVRRRRYRAQDPALLTRDLLARAGELRAALDTVTGNAWQRAGRRAGEPRSILEVAQRAAHEARHHTYDIERSVPAAG